MERPSPHSRFNYSSSSAKKLEPLSQKNQSFNDLDEQAAQYFSENIEESPLKMDRRLAEDHQFKVPEFPNNENNIKLAKRVIIKDELK